MLVAKSFLWLGGLYEVKTNALCGYDTCSSVTSYLHVVCLIFVKFGTGEGILYKVLYSKWEVCEYRLSDGRSYGS